jgi:hypothetical protein
VEAQNVMADSIAERGLLSGRLHYREAWLYFENRFLGLTYMLDATEHSPEGNDIADFARTFRDACAPPQCTRITLRDIQRSARLTLADPILYYALYGFAGSYIGLGKTTSSLPMIPLGHDVRVLPSLGFQLTPYGTERLIRTAITSGSSARENARLTAVTLRLGKTGAAKAWGLDASMSDIRVFGHLRVRVAANVWR